MENKTDIEISKNKEHAVAVDSSGNTLSAWSDKSLLLPIKDDEFKNIQLTCANGKHVSYHQNPKQAAEAFHTVRDQLNSQLSALPDIVRSFKNHQLEMGHVSVSSGEHPTPLASACDRIKDQSDKQR